MAFPEMRRQVHFLNWVERQFPNSYAALPEPAKDKQARDKQAHHFHHVLIDVNSILHKACRRSSSVGEIGFQTIKELDKIIAVCRPTKSLMLAFDGAAPLAKMQTQVLRRRRRKISSSAPANAEQIADAVELEAGEEAARDLEEAESDSQAFDAVEETTTDAHVAKRKRKRRGGKGPLGEDWGLHITPGTETMDALLETAQFWACERLQRSHKFARVTVSISGPDIPGEGELKVYGYAKRLHEQTMRRRAQSRVQHPTFAIVGTDSDLVWLALACDVPNVTVMTERTPRVKGFLQLDSIREQMAQQFGCKMGDPMLSRLQLDFTLLSLLLGKTYVPNLRGATLARLWTSYKSVFLKTREHMVSTVHHPAQSGNAAVSELVLNWPIVGKVLTAACREVPSLQDLLENRVSPPNSGVREEGDSDADEDVLLLADMDPELAAEVKQMIANPQEAVRRYVQGLCWNLEQYCTGHCWDFSFLYPFPFAPALSDLLKYGPSLTAVTSAGSGAPMSQHEVSMSLLPRTASFLVPTCLQHLMDPAQTHLTGGWYDRYTRARNIVPALQRLTEAIGSVSKDQFTEAELRRGQIGKVYTFCKAYDSPAPPADFAVPRPPTVKGKTLSELRQPLNLRVECHSDAYHRPTSRLWGAAGMRAHKQQEQQQQKKKKRRPHARAVTDKKPKILASAADSVGVQAALVTH